MRLRLSALVAALCWLVPTTALSNDWDALKADDAIVLMRHALAPGGGDPSGFQVDDCATQRNLDARGRAQAFDIGAQFAARDIGFDTVWTSAWCRCRDTAELLDLGAPEVLPSLNSFFAGQGDRAGQTAATLATLAETGGRRLLVTHQVNITALTGVFPQSGEVIVTELKDGALRVTGRILIEPPK